METLLGSYLEEPEAELKDNYGAFDPAFLSSNATLGCGKDTKKGNRRQLPSKSSSFIVPSLNFVLTKRFESSNLNFDALLSKS